MSASTGSAPAATLATLTVTDLEHLIRRVVREEISHAFSTIAPNPVHDWSHEGPDDPAGDAILLREALEAIAQIEQGLEVPMPWEEFKAELERAEAAGELPA